MSGHVKGQVEDILPCGKLIPNTCSAQQHMFPFNHSFSGILKTENTEVRVIILSLKEERNDTCLILSPVSARTEASCGVSLMSQHYFTSAKYKTCRISRTASVFKATQKSDLFDFSTQVLYEEPKEYYCKNTKAV
jgi:hypothetical protein